eukprot:1189170-Prorocentrum_minimum.AAC.1
MHSYWKIACSNPFFFNCAVIPEKCQELEGGEWTHTALKSHSKDSKEGNLVKNYVRQFMATHSLPPDFPDHNHYRKERKPHHP